MTKIKKYIFGYGSLLSPDEIFYTLGKKVDVIYPVKLNGWIRDWSVICGNNTSQRYVLQPTGQVPEFVSTLNVRLPSETEKATDPCGVLFEVNDVDLDKMDKREQHYDRVDVTENITPAPPGIVYTYTGTKNHLVFANPELEVVLPSSYMDTVTKGAKALHPEFFEEYQRTTLPPSCEIRACIFTDK